MRKDRALTLASLLESFFHKCLMIQRKVSDATVAAYRDTFRLFVVFASGLAGKKPCQLAVEDLDRDVVLRFLDHLERNRGNTVRTRNARLAAIRSFFQHVAYLDPACMGVAQRVLAIPSKRADKAMLGHLEGEELDAVLAAPDHSTTQGRRDHALLLFLARTGARVSEAIAVDACHLRLNRPPQVLLQGKGAKERIVPLGADLAQVLKALCTELGVSLEASFPVFATAKGKRLTRWGVTHIVRRAVTKASTQMPALLRQAISPHTFRHTVAMNLLRSGVDLNVIRSWLGHASLDTTHQYVEADVEMKRRALQMCQVTENKPARYQAPDELLALLERL